MRNGQGQREVGILRAMASTKPRASPNEDDRPTFNRSMIEQLDPSNPSLTTAPGDTDVAAPNGGTARVA